MHILNTGRHVNKAEEPQSLKMSDAGSTMPILDTTGTVSPMAQTKEAETNTCGSAVIISHVGNGIDDSECLWSTSRRLPVYDSRDVSGHHSHLDIEDVLMRRRLHRLRTSNPVEDDVRHGPDSDHGKHGRKTSAATKSSISNSLEKGGFDCDDLGDDHEWMMNNRRMMNRGRSRPSKKFIGPALMYLCKKAVDSFFF